MKKPSDEVFARLEILQRIIRELEECPDCGESPKLLPELYRERSKLLLEIENLSEEKEEKKSSCVEF